VDAPDGPVRQDLSVVAGDGQVRAEGRAADLFAEHDAGLRRAQSSSSREGKTVGLQPGQAGIAPWLRLEDVRGRGTIDGPAPPAVRELGQEELVHHSGQREPHVVGDPERVRDEVPELVGEALRGEWADVAELTDRHLSRWEDDNRSGAVLPDRRQQLVGVAPGNPQLVLDAGPGLSFGKQSLQDGPGVADAVGLRSHREARGDDGGSDAEPPNCGLGVAQPELTRPWFVERGHVDVVQPHGELVPCGHQVWSDGSRVETSVPAGTTRSS
jgi:hypothetical protein